MSILSKSNIVTGNTVQPTDVSQIVDALTASGSYNLYVSGSVGIGVTTGSGTIPTSASLYVNGNISGSGNITISGIITASSVSANAIYGSLYATGDVHVTRVDQAYGYILRPNVNGFKNVQFAVEGGGTLDNLYVNSNLSTFTGKISGSSLQLLGAITASNIGTIAAVNLNSNASQYLNGAGTFTTLTVTGFTPTSSFNTFTASYYTDSASFNSRINGITIPSQTQIVSGSTYAYVTGTSVIVSGSNAGTTQFIVTGSQYTTGTITSTGFIQASARSVKDNILPFTGSALSLIKDIDVVSYVYKHKPEEPKIGFIADDTNEIFSTKAQNVMDQGNVIGVLIKAVQELQEEIEILKNK